MLDSTGHGPTTAERASAATAEADGPIAMSVRLAREFAAPVGLLDAATGAWRVRVGRAQGSWPVPAEAIARATAGVLARGPAEVWPPSRAGEPPRPALPVPRPGGPPWLGLVGFASGPAAEAEPHGLGPACPPRALLAWGRSVAEALGRDAADRDGESRRHIARLIRRLRVSDPPERFQNLAVGSLRAALGAAAAAWVPASGHEPVVVAGTLEGVEADTWRDLVRAAGLPLAPSPSQGPAAPPPRPASGRAHPLASAAIVPGDAENPAGWIVVVPAPGRGGKAGAGAGPEVDLDAVAPVASLISTQRSNGRSYADLKDLLFGVVRALTAAIDAKDPYTSGHSERVARIAVRLAEALGMSSNQRGDLYLMGLLHDVGKIGVDDVVLKKSGPLTPEEYRQIQSHVAIGVHILADLKKLSHLLPGVSGHHENMDGSGYPAGLRGESIPLEARILAVADAFDAMSSNRPYRRRMSPPQIDEIFRRGSGAQWDPGVVAAMFACRDDLEAIRSKGLGESLQAAVSDTLGRSSATH